MVLSLVNTMQRPAMEFNRIPPITASAFINDNERNLHQAQSWTERTGITTIGWTGVGNHA
jgi:hypothetical protein